MSSPRGRRPIGMRARMAGAVLVGALAALSGALTVLAQEAPSAEALEKMARVVTELDPQIDAIELRSFSAIGPRGAQTYFRYISPDQYFLFGGLAGDQAAYLVVGEGKAILYDVRRGNIALLRSAVPLLSAEMDTGGAVARWGFKSAPGAPKESQALLRVDFPSLLQYPNIVSRQVESIGGGKFRLVQTSGLGGHLIATVDPQKPVAFTGLEIWSKEGQLLFDLALRVNEQVPTGKISLPEMKSLRARFKNEQKPVPTDMISAMRLVGLTLLPLGFGAGPAGLKFRDGLGQWAGGKADWPAMEAKYARDLPMLRQLMPMPQ